MGVVAPVVFPVVVVTVLGVLAPAAVVFLAAAAAVVCQFLIWPPSK